MSMSEREVSEHPDTRRPLPRWLVVPVIILSAAVTAAAMSMTGLRGPAVAWERANRGIEEVWFGGRAPEPAPGDPSGAVLTAAAVPGIPTIAAGAPLVHADRGFCTSCHAVIGAQGTPVPAIHSMSVMSHEYRGVCANCHVSRVAPSLGGLMPVAGTPVAAKPDPLTRGPTEAEWQGLEVVPGASGVVVQSAEGRAKRLGFEKGDVISSINALPVRTMADFVSVTQNGRLSQGAVIVRRADRRLAFELAEPTANPPPPPEAQPRGGSETRWGSPGAAPIVLPPPNARF